MDLAEFSLHSVASLETKPSDSHHTSTDPFNIVTGVLEAS